MSLYSRFKTDPKLEKEGVLVEFGPNSKDETILIRIARAGGANDAYNKRIEAKFKPMRRQLQNETADTQAVVKNVKEVFAETVVLGWENMEDQQGNPLAFSKDACLQLFDDLPDLFSDVQDYASKAAIYRADIREADAKN